jgi:hypothetical protein
MVMSMQTYPRPRAEAYGFDSIPVGTSGIPAVAAGSRTTPEVDGVDGVRIAMRESHSRLDVVHEAKPWLPLLGVPTLGGVVVE